MKPKPAPARKATHKAADLGPTFSTTAATPSGAKKRPIMTTQKNGSVKAIDNKRNAPVDGKGYVILQGGAVEERPDIFDVFLRENVRLGPAHHSAIVGKPLKCCNEMLEENQAFVAIPTGSGQLFLHAHCLRSLLQHRVGNDEVAEEFTSIREAMIAKGGVPVP